MLVGAGDVFAGGALSAFAQQVPRKLIGWDPTTLVPAVVDVARCLVPAEVERRWWGLVGGDRVVLTLPEATTAQDAGHGRPRASTYVRDAILVQAPRLVGQSGRRVGGW